MKIFEYVRKILFKENLQWKGERPTDLALQLVEKGLVKKKTRILDLGCGFGRNSNYFASLGAKVDAINISKEELNEARRRAGELGLKVNYIEADAADLPFRKGRFDIVLDAGCSHMCDRDAQKKIVEGVNKVLKPRGYLQYFGFSKEHPSYKDDPDSSQFRDIVDIKAQYGKYFETLSVKEVRWDHAGSEHVGLEVLMRKKD